MKKTPGTLHNVVQCYIKIVHGVFFSRSSLIQDKVIQKYTVNGKFSSKISTRENNILIVHPN